MLKTISFSSLDLKNLIDGLMDPSKRGTRIHTCSELGLAFIAFLHDAKEGKEASGVKYLLDEFGAM